MRLNQTQPEFVHDHLQVIASLYMRHWLAMNYKWSTTAIQSKTYNWTHLFYMRHFNIFCPFGALEIRSLDLDFDFTPKALMCCVHFRGMHTIQSKILLLNVDKVADVHVLIWYQLTNACVQIQIRRAHFSESISAALLLFKEIKTLTHFNAFAPYSFHLYAFNSSLEVGNPQTLCAASRDSHKTH